MRLLSALVLPRRRPHEGGADRLTGPVGDAAASAACPASRDAPPPPPPRKNRAGDCGPGPAARSRHRGSRVRPVGGRPRGKARRRGTGAPAPVRTRGAVPAAVLTAAFALLATALRAAGQEEVRPTVSINSPSVAEGAAGTTATLTFTVSLGAASAEAVTVDYAEGTGGTAASETDYTAPASGTLTFAADETSKTIAVSVTGDATDEPDETVVVTLGNASGATVGTGTGTGTITDDDAAPTVTLALADDSIPENGGATTVSATLSHPSSADTTITITPVADAYTVGSDGTITIAAGDTANASDTAAISAVDNDTGEADRSVTVTGAADNAQGIGQVTGASLTLEDDDGGSGPTEPSDDEPTVSINSPSVAEGAAGTTATLTFTVSLDAASDGEVTVDYGEGTGGTAESGTDYTAPASGTLTFAADETSRTIAVSVTGDATDEPDETVVVTLGNASGATIGTGTGTGTITDDDAAPTVTLSLADDSISENGGATTVSATLSHPSSAATTITISPVADAYTVGSDATITIAAGDTANASDTAAISAVDNDTGEADRSVTVTGSADNAQGIGQVTGASLTLEDDDGGADPAGPSDDEPTVSINSPSVAEGAAGTTATLTFTVSLGAASTEAVTVDYAEGTGGTAESGTDYTAPASGTLTFAAGDTSRSITVSVTGDATDEPDETVVLTLGNASGATIGTASGTGTITDDDAAPTVTLALADDSIPENGGATTVSATLSHPSSAATTITISPVADAYTVGSDATITIAAGETANASDTAAITAVDNDTGEADRSVTVTGSADNAQGIGQVTGASLTLEDDDGGSGPTEPSDDEPTVSINSPSVAEGAAGTTATLTFTVSLDAAGDGEVTVDYAEGTGGTAASGTDYTAPASGTLTFAAGDTSGTITVSVTGDATDEPDETVVLTLGNASGATIGTGTGTGTITDDDAAPTVTLALADDSISENGGTTTVSATLSHASSEATTITITALANAYTVGADDTITIPAGDTANASDTAAITAVDNATDEANRSVTVTGSASNTQGAGLVTGAGLTLIDDDGQPSLTINAPSVAEGDSGSASLNFTVTLSPAGTEAVTVDYAAGTGGTAESGADYTAPASGTLTFAVGDTSKSITVSVTGDTTDEPDETVVVTLGNASGATIGSGTGTGTITDDDAAPTVTLSLADDSISENGGSTTVSATLSHPSSEATTITIASLADAYTVGSDGTITIPAGDTANASDTAAISAVDNDTGEADRSVTVTGSANNTQGIGQVTGASLTLEDDDGGSGPTEPPDDEPTMSIDSPSVAEGAAGTTATLTFTVSLGAASAEAVTVAYAAATGGTATAGTDYAAPASGTLTIAAGDTGATIAVTVIGDGVDEPDETILMTLGEPAGATLGTGTGTGTITDDDAAPTVTLALADDSIPENGGTTTVSATLGNASSEATTITIAALADAYTVGADDTITIAAGDTANASDTVTITAVDNATDEANRSVTVTGSASNTQGAGPVTGAGLTLLDDDGEPSLTINAPGVTEGDSGSASLIYTVTLSPASGGEVTVDYAEGTGGTATSGTDYTAPASGTLTFAAGDTSRTITVSVTGDTTDEPDETVVVTLGNASGATVGTASGTGTIRDDDAAPTVTLSLADDSIPENGGSTTVSATLNHPSSAATTITITAVADAYTVGSDATITIPAGDTANASDTATITAVDNDTGEADRSVTVTGSAGNTQGIGQVTGASLTLEDDDGQSSLTINAPSVTEGDSGSASLIYTVTLSPPSTGEVTVGYAEGTGGTAASGTDYTALASGTLTFAAGDTSRTITVSVTGDTTDEPDETVVVTLGNASGAAVGTASGTGTITDDDAAPTVTLAVADDSISENGGATTVSATLSHPSSAATTITISALADVYAVGPDATITIPAGETANASDTATISAVDNDTGGADHIVIVIGSASNAQGIGPVTGAVLTIGDDDGGGSGSARPQDALPTLSIYSPSVTEGDSGSVSLHYTVTLSAASAGAVTVGYAEGTGGTATAGTDYTALASGTLTFAAGETSRTITVSVTGDTTDEPNETVVVTLSGPSSGATVGTGTGTGTITDDDAAPTVTLSLADNAISEGGHGDGIGDAEPRFERGDHDHDHDHELYLARGQEFVLLGVGRVDHHPRRAYGERSGHGDDHGGGQLVRLVEPHRHGYRLRRQHAGGGFGNGSNPGADRRRRDAVADDQLAERNGG